MIRRVRLKGVSPRVLPPTSSGLFGRAVRAGWLWALCALAAWAKCEPPAGRAAQSDGKIALAAGAPGGAPPPGNAREGRFQRGGDGWVVFKRSPVVVLRGRVRGVVSAVDRPAGVVTVRTGAGALTLKAHPESIAALRPGQLFEGAYRSYRGIAWYDRAAIAKPSDPVVIDLLGAVHGSNPRQGFLALTSGRQLFTMSAHPADIAGLAPGELVRVRYRRYGKRRWVDEVAVRVDDGTRACAPR